jgi:hypothetical protein
VIVPPAITSGAEPPKPAKNRNMRNCVIVLACEHAKLKTDSGRLHLAENREGDVQRTEKQYIRRSQNQLPSVKL